MPVVVALSKPDSLGEKDTDPLKRNCQPIATAEVDKKEEASKNSESKEQGCIYTYNKNHLKF